MHLFRSVGFSAAAATTFLLGAALFGAMLLLPLYYQVDRGETALSAGLLIAPQGIGAALVMPISGRLTDRIGGGVLALAGVLARAPGGRPPRRGLCGGRARHERRADQRAGAGGALGVPGNAGRAY